jgi:hypothetical protein
MPDLDTPQPRHLWRRAFAFGLDYLLVSVAAFGLVAMLPASERRVVAPPFVTFGSFSCQSVQSIPQALLTRLQSHDFDLGRITGARVCERRSFGQLTSREFRMYFDQTQTHSGWRTKHIGAEITPNGDIVARYAPNGLLALLFLLAGSAGLARLGRRSPGKALLGLRIAPNPQPASREWRKLWPLIALSALSLLTQILAGPWVMDVVLRDPMFGIASDPLPFSLGMASFGFGAGLLVFTLWYYVWPLIRWNGAARHDRASGARVIRS